MGRVLDPRVYRAAFVPAVLALFLAAFSLTGRPSPATTDIAPDAFDGPRAFGAGAQPARNSLRELAASFPDRRPGSAGDVELARRVGDSFERAGFRVRRSEQPGETVEGDVDLQTVVGERPGLSSRRIVLLAHRDAVAGAGDATLSGTAALLELARIFSGRDLQKTLVLVSASGGSAGFAGARAWARQPGGPVDAVLVLGDLAGPQLRKPFVVPWSASGPPPPLALRRTVETALRTETGQDPGGPRASGQWARRAFPLTVSEQGPINAQGLPAVLVSMSGELGPEPGAVADQQRFERAGRGVLRAVSALEAARPAGAAAGDDDPGPAFSGARGVVTVERLLPDWSVRLLVGALLAPALLAALDGFFRVRRRRVPVRGWIVWALLAALPFLLAWGWLRLLDALDAVIALPVPPAPGVLEPDGGDWVAAGSVALVAALGWFGLRPPVLRAAGVRGDAAAGGAAAAVALLLGLLVLAVWVANPYAAAVLLPAAHLWLLVAAPGTRLRGPLAAAAVAGGLLLPALVVLYYLAALDLGPLDALWLLFQAGAGGTVGLLDALALSLAAGLLLCVLTILVARRRATEQAPPALPVTRGPGRYAGPGSLGGTESALRR